MIPERVAEWTGPIPGIFLNAFISYINPMYKGEPTALKRNQLCDLMKALPNRVLKIEIQNSDAVLLEPYVIGKDMQGVDVIVGFDIKLDSWQTLDISGVIGAMATGDKILPERDSSGQFKNITASYHRIKAPEL